MAVKPRYKLKPKVLKRLFRRMSPKLRTHRGSLILAVLAMIGASAMEIVRPWPLKVIFDGILIPQPEPDAITARAMAFAGGEDLLLALAASTILLIAIAGGLMTYTQSYLIAKVGQKVVASIRFDLYRHIQRLSHSFHDTASTGDILARLTGDVRMMRDLLVNAAIYASARVLVVLGTLLVMALMDWRLTLASVCILPLLIVVSFRFGDEIKGAARKQRRKEGKIAVVMNESISAITVVKGFAREAYEEARFARQNNSSARAGLAATKLEGKMDRIVQVILAVGACVVIWYGVNRVRAGALTPGDLLVFSAYMTALYKPVRKLAALTGRVAKATASGERLLEIFDLVPDVREASDAVTAPSFRGEVTFDAIDFAYPNGASVLRGAGLRIGAGETVALVGPSGVGKSTAARLLLRFYDPSEGRVMIDGQDIREFTLDSLRDQIAVVLQESLLFATTIRDNIAYGRLDASFSEIRDAAREAGADAFIQRLPEGYDTVVGERGATLSGGQRQRIAIARAILRDAAILILDEPLTGLDRDSATSVTAALRRAARGRTTLVIAHDGPALALADRVVRVSNGGFHEDGSKGPDVSSVQVVA